ncbi:OmpA family protein [Runella sp.]|uniref:OmpA family protein n=1 Tax=Runella sp. TaxID=1960881 RepID=UPI0030197AEC
MLRKRAKIVGFSILSWSCMGQALPCLQLYGTIANATNQAPIEQTQLIVKTATQETIIQTTLMNGNYQISLPCHAATLTVSARGYRSLTLPISPKETASSRVRFFVPFLLTPIDRQTIDKPYFQIEQRHVELAPAHAQQKKYATRLFQVIDAVTEQPVPALLCLFYTQTSEKKCTELYTNQPAFEVVFKEPDIIALEVKAKDYQPYKGNLILEQLDNQQRTYLIRLVRELTVLSVIASDTNGTYWLTNPHQRIALQKHQGNYHYLFIPEGHYQLCLSDKSDSLVALENIEVKAGFNSRLFKKMSPIKEDKKAPNLPIVSESIPSGSTLYFNQSEYKLLHAAKIQLDTLAAWLSVQPDQKILIVGHTDNIGSAQLNQTLSEFRAKVTFNYLLEKGVRASQMSWKGISSYLPAVPNDTESHRKQNRRVEILLPAPIPAKL